MATLAFATAALTTERRLALAAVTSGAVELEAPELVNLPRPAHRGLQLFFSISSAHLQDVRRHRLEVPGDAISMRRPARQRLEDQHLERAGEKLRADGMLVPHVDV